MVLCMTVEPGYGGQKYIEEVESKITAIRKRVSTDVDIEVDGGIGAENILRPVGAGANIIVAGTAVFKDDIGKNIKEIMRQCEQL